MHWIRILLTGLAVLTAGAAPALAERDGVKSYIFGNSLINHLSDSPGTAVPYWLAQLASAGGKSFATAGQWGFLRDFTDLPPKPNWSFPGVKSAGAPRAGANFDTVMINPANFI
nr:calcium-binding protein [Roseovarius sp.]